MNNSSILIVLILLNLIISTSLYLYLHKKTRINIKYIFTDNVIVGMIAGVSICYFYNFISIYSQSPYLIFLTLILSVFTVALLSFLFTMIRFWRTPIRRMKAQIGEIVSPADGNVLYIKQIESGDIPVTIKNGLSAKISEIAQTELLNQSSWLIGINMTPFDVHKNCASVGGLIILNKHIPGKFLSLKNPEASIQNERNTLVIKSDSNEFFGVVQTASRLVRRIDSYVKEGQSINQGDWFGMIRFGSQVDILIPRIYKVNIKVGEQVYAGKSIIALK
jgi:phosphatidylserine decarboxylase